MIILYVLCLVLLSFTVVITVNCFNYKKASYNNGQRRDVLIVLGCYTKKDGSLTPALRERIYKVAELYHKGISEVVICSGAAVANNYVEAEIMAQSLIEAGVPNSSILREKQSRCTYDNLMYSQQIMKERNLNTAVIVSSPWHLRKASSYASKLKIEHTLEKSKFPPEYPLIFIGTIYLYININMFINFLWYQKNKRQKFR